MALLMRNVDGSGGCGGAVVDHEPSHEIEGGFVLLRLFISERDDEVAAALEAGGEFLLEGGGDRLDGGGDETRLPAHVGAIVGLSVKEAAELEIGFVVAEGEAAEEVEHGLGLGEGEAHLARGEHVNQIVGRERVDALALRGGGVGFLPEAINDAGPSERNIGGRWDDRVKAERGALQFGPVGLQEID